MLVSKFMVVNYHVQITNFNKGFHFSATLTKVNFTLNSYKNILCLLYN